MSLFPYDHAASYFRDTFEGVVEIGEKKLTWSAYGGTTVFTLSEINQPTYDGLLVSEEILLEFVHPELQHVTAELASRINKWCTLSAFIPATQTEPARLVAKVGIFSTNREAAERVYAPLIAMEAASVCWHAARLSAGQLEANPESSLFSDTDKMPPYVQADFEAVKSLIDTQRGFFGSLGDFHYTVEFPWDSGALSSSFNSEEFQVHAREAGYTDEQIAIAGGRTSLFQIMFIQHPMYGWGLQSRLELPVSPEGGSAVALVDELNRWELSGPDLPPMFGAWCLGERAPTFLTFIPTQMCLPGLVYNLTVWNMVRHFRVRDWLPDKPMSSH